MKNRFTFKNRSFSKKDDVDESDSYGPSEITLRNVISYSKSLSVMKTRFIGPINIILN